MLVFNTLLVVAVAASFVDDVNTAAVAYIYQRNNGGLTRVLRVGDPQNQIAEPWKVKTFEAYKLKPNVVNSPTQDVHADKDEYGINHIARLVKEGQRKQLITAQLSKPKQSIAALSGKYLKLENANIETPLTIIKQDDEGTEQSSKKFVEVKNFVIHEYVDKKNQGAIKNFGDTVHPVHEIPKGKDAIKLEKYNPTNHNSKSIVKQNSANSKENSHNVRDEKNSHTNQINDNTAKPRHDSSKQQDRNLDDFIVKHRHDKSRPIYESGDLYEQDYPTYDGMRSYKESLLGKNNYYTPYKNKLKDYYKSLGDYYKNRNAKFGIDYKGYHNEKADKKHDNSKFYNYKGYQEAGKKEDGKQSKQAGNDGEKNFFFVKEWNTGYNDEWDRDEYKKDRDFYDDADKTGWNRKGNKVNEFKGHITGDRNEGAKSGSSSGDEKYGSSHSYNKMTADDESEDKYSANKGDELKYKKNKQYKNHTGKNHRKKYGYGNEEAKERK